MCPKPHCSEKSCLTAEHLRQWHRCRTAWGLRGNRSAVRQRLRFCLRVSFDPRFACLRTDDCLRRGASAERRAGSGWAGAETALVPTKTSSSAARLVVILTLLAYGFSLTARGLRSGLQNPEGRRSLLRWGTRRRWGKHQLLRWGKHHQRRREEQPVRCPWAERRSR